MRGERGWVGPRQRVEAEQGVGIDDDGDLETLEQPRHERVRLCAGDRAPARARRRRLALPRP